MSRRDQRQPTSGLGLNAIRTDAEIAEEFNRRHPGARHNRKSVAQARSIAERKIRKLLSADQDIREMFALDREGNDQ